MKNKIKNIPLSVKISGIFIMANIFSLVVIVVLLLGINSLSTSRCPEALICICTPRILSSPSEK